MRSCRLCRCRRADGKLPDCREVLTIVMRSIFCAGAVALAVLLPTAASAHPPGTPVSRPAPPAQIHELGFARRTTGLQSPVRRSRRAQAALRNGALCLSTNGSADDLQPVQVARIDIEPRLFVVPARVVRTGVRRKYALDAVRHAVCQCRESQNGQSQFGTKIGSLVDGKGILSTYGSEGAKNAAGIASSAANAPAAGGVTLQIGLPAACGVPNLRAWPI